MGSDCMSCARLDREKGDRCEAFKRGIPIPILTGDQRHIDPVEGDGGIVWTPAPGLEFMDVGPNRFVTKATL
jgi:hypothetical protein